MGVCHSDECGWMGGWLLDGCWMEVRTDTQTVTARHSTFFWCVGTGSQLWQSRLPRSDQSPHSLTVSHPPSLPASAHGPLRHHHHSQPCSLARWLRTPLLCGTLLFIHTNTVARTAPLFSPPTPPRRLCSLHVSRPLLPPPAPPLLTALALSSLGLLVLAVAARHREPGCRLRSWWWRTKERWRDSPPVRRAPWLSPLRTVTTVTSALRQRPQAPRTGVAVSRPPSPAGSTGPWTNM